MKFSWWENFWAQRKTPPHFLRVVTGPEWPEIWPPDTIFVQGEHGQEWSAAFVCPCGCGDIVYLNLLPHFRPRWRLRRGAHGRPTLSPSVWRQVKCQSHFILRDGRVTMCRWHYNSDHD